MSAYEPLDGKVLRTLSICLATLCLLFILASLVSAERFWDDVEIRVVETWSDPGGGGRDLMFDVSSDGTRIVLAGYRAEGDLLVTDRGLDVLATLTPPGEGTTVEGVHWSQTGRWVYAWGTAEGVDHDLLWMWNGTSYEPTEELFENSTTPLARLDSVLFVAEDDILVLAGRDANGTSRVILWETLWSTVRRDLVWDGNATVSHVGTDISFIVCIDGRGNVTTIGGYDWDEVRDLGGHASTPTATSLNTYFRYTWIVGYVDGTAGFWGGYPLRLEMNASFGDGPVQATSFCIPFGEGYYLVATPDTSTTSRVAAYYFDAGVRADNPVSEPMVLPSTLTMMAMDLLVEGQVWCGFSDGSIALLNVTTVPDLPPWAAIEVPTWQQDVTGDFVASGTYHDDHDAIEYIRVSIAGSEWKDANFSDGRWTFPVDVSLYGEGEQRLVVAVYDGRTESFNETFFELPLTNGVKDEWPRGVPAIPLTVLAVGLLLFWVWRRKRGGAGT